MAANLKKTLTPATVNFDDWEPAIDDVLVYKRKKRRLDPASLVSSAAAADPAADTAAELKTRRRRKRKALLQLKDKYQREILMWEQLSESLKAVENRRPAYAAAESSGGGGGDTVVELPPSTPPCSSLLSEVFLQVEAQEAIIRDFSQLCDVAESLCSAHEEKVKQQFIDLPIWKSPQELMASLCED